MLKKSLLKPPDLSSNQDQEGNTNLKVHNPDQREFTVTTTVGGVLSVKQLVIWRGLAVFIMIIILLAGIITSTFLLRMLKQ